MAWMDLGGIMPTEISQRERETYLQVESKKKKRTHRYREQIDRFQRWAWGVGEMDEGGPSTNFQS